MPSIVVRLGCEVEAAPRPDTLKGGVTMSAPVDRWSNGERYEAFVGRWSRPIARELLRWLGVPAGARWLDVGCGTGALTQTILADAAPARVLGVDRADGYVALARERVADPRAGFLVGDAQALPVVDGTFDAAVSGLVLNFVPRPEQMLAEMARALRPGGVASLYVWDYAGEMQLLRHFWNAAVALDSAAQTLDEGVRFPLCQPKALAEVVQAAGFARVATRAIDAPTVFGDFDDYWAPFLSGEGPAPGYAMSLDLARRVALRERIRAGLPIGADGSIVLMARAWAAEWMRRCIQSHSKGE